MKTPYHFFLANAGYSYDPKTETPMKGRIRCAQLLAKAEQTACDLGYAFEWCMDQYSDSSEFSEESPAYSLWVCVMRDPDGLAVDSLGGVDFGRDGTPWGDSYRRVVEAEMACEIPA